MQNPLSWLVQNIKILKGSVNKGLKQQKPKDVWNMASGTRFERNWGFQCEVWCIFFFLNTEWLCQSTKVSSFCPTHFSISLLTPTDHLEFPKKRWKMNFLSSLNEFIPLSRGKAYFFLSSGGAGDTGQEIKLIQKTIELYE